MGQVRLYATLRARADEERAVEIVWSSGDTIGDVIQELLRRKPGLEGHVIGEDGGLVKYVSVFLNGRDIRHLDGLETAVNGAAEIAIFPPVAGG